MHSAQHRSMLNKVPLVTLAFWIIKILATTVGETGADFLNFNLGFGLTATSLLAALVLIAFLWLQLRQDRSRRSSGHDIRLEPGQVRCRQFLQTGR